MNPYHYQTLDDKPPLHGRDLARRLQRLRRHAKRRGFRVLRVFADFSLVTVRTEPPRAVCGLRGVDLEMIEAALRLPPTEASPAFKPVPLKDAEIDRIIERVGAAELLAGLDRMTGPAIRTAAE
jgi:hypothetical protein